MSAYFLNVRLDKFNSLDSETRYAEITILDVKYASEHFGYYIAEAKIEDPVYNQKFKVNLEATDGSFSPRDVLCGTVSFSSLSGEGTYDERAIYLPDGIVLKAESDNLKYVCQSSSFSLYGSLNALNKRLSSMFYAHLGSKSGGLCAAVLLGNRDALEDGVSRDFSRVGISHLLAISGLHLSVIVFLLETFLERLNFKKGLRNSLSIAFILFFMALTGFSFSVIRAGIMHIVRIIASSIGKSNDSLTTLSFSVALIIFTNPYSILDCGLWLSALSSYACIAYSMLEKGKAAKVIRYNNKIKDKTSRLFLRILSTVKLTLLITAFTLPVSWRAFGEVSLVSPISNIIFIPLITIYLYLSIFYILLYPIKILISPSALLIDAVAYAIVISVGKISGLRGIVVSLRYSFVEYIVFALFCFVAILPFVKQKNRKILNIAALFCVLCLAARLTAAKIPESSSADAMYVNSGLNDGLVVRSELEYIIIDSSDGSYGFTKELLYSAKQMRSCEINSYVLTHYHKKHISSIERLTNSAIVRNIIAPFPKTENEASTMESIFSICKDKNINVVLYDRADGETIASGKTELNFFEYAELGRSTHPIISFGVSYNDISILYLGSSFNESSGSTEEYASGSDAVILGAHNPKYKETFEFKTSGRLVATGSAYSFMSDAMKERVAPENILEESKNHFHFDMK